MYGGMGAWEDSNKLEEYRREVDRIDQQIVDFLNQRAEIVLKIRVWKRSKKKGVYDYERENQVLSFLKSYDKKEILPKKSLERIYQEIISSCRELGFK